MHPHELHGHSPRLRIEALQPGHAAELFDALDDPRVLEYCDGTRPGGVVDLEREYARLRAGAPAGRGELWLNWALRRVDDARCIGTLQATVVPGSNAWIGYTIAPAAWGRGYASEAVAWLIGELRTRHAVGSVLASVDERNSRSSKVLLRNGFRCLGPRPADLRGQATVDLHFILGPGA